MIYQHWHGILPKSTHGIMLQIQKPPVICWSWSFSSSQIWGPSYGLGMLCWGRSSKVTYCYWHLSPSTAVGDFVGEWQLYTSTHVASCLHQPMSLCSRSNQQPAICWSLVAKAKSEVPLTGLAWCVEVKAMLLISRCWILGRCMTMLCQHSYGILPPSIHVIMLTKQPEIWWSLVAHAKFEAPVMGLVWCVEVEEGRPLLPMAVGDLAGARQW